MTSFSERLNSIRAAVLGANDGIVSVSALLVCVAASHPTNLTLLITAVGAILAGAASMAVGEYVSVHAQLDAETEAHVAVTASPTRAALSSAVSFTMGAAIPSTAILCAPLAWRVPVTVVCVLLALGLCGWASSHISGIPPLKPVLRVMCGGGAALAVTFAAGLLTG